MYHQGITIFWVLLKHIAQNRLPTEKRNIRKHCWKMLSKCVSEHCSTIKALPCFNLYPTPHTLWLGVPGNKKKRKLFFFFQKTRGLPTNIIQHYIYSVAHIAVCTILLVCVHCFGLPAENLNIWLCWKMLSKPVCIRAWPGKENLLAVAHVYNPGHQ